MVQYLPTGEFQWVTVSREEILNTLDDADYGFIAEVDLKCPVHLHDKLNDYPLAADHLTITPEMLSTFQKEKNSQSSSTKLAPNLLEKKNYIVHYRNLKYYIEQGMEVNFLIFCSQNPEKATWRRKI